MAGVVPILPKFTFIDATGTPLAGGKVYTYQAGTSTPATTYQDSALGSPNTNPVVLDVNGQATMWGPATQAYKFIVKTSADVLVDTMDNIPVSLSAIALAASSGASLVGFLQDGTGAVSRPAQDELRDRVSVKQFGAVGDGVTDDTAAIQLALNFGQYRTVYFPKGTYIVSSSLNYKTQTRLLGDGIGTTIKAATGWNPAIPTITPGTYTPTLSYAPMLYTASPIQWWSMEGLNFDGNNQDCYGIWFMENFYGSMRDVYVMNTNKRPYTNIRGQAITHDDFVCYQCGDGVVTYDNTNLHFTGGGFERLSGTWSFDQRQPNSYSKGGVTLDDVWFESDTTNFPTEGFLRMSGRRNRACIHANLATTATTERVLELNDTTDSRTVDGITMGANPCGNGEFTINNSAGAMLINAKAGAYGNKVKGFFSASKVTDSGNGNTFDVNGSLSVPVQNITNRFQVRYGATGSGISLGATSFVLDADYNAGTPIIRFLGNNGNTLDLDSGKLRLTSALGQEFVATTGAISWSASSYTFLGSSGATGYQKPMYLGAYSLWVDSTGKLRIKSGAPTSDTDGTVVGTQT